MDEMLLQTPAENEKPSLRQRVPQWCRILLQIASFFLCIALILCLLATALVADLRQLLQANTLEQLMKSTFTAMVDSVPETPDTEASDSLILWAHQELNTALDGAYEIPLETVQTFFRESTVLDYLAQQTGTAVSEVLTLGYIESDLLSAEEVRSLVEENRALMGQLCGLEFSDAQLDMVVDAVVDALADSGLEEIVEGAAGELLESQEPIAIGPVSLNMTISEFLAALLSVLSGSLWAAVLGSLLTILALLAAANFYNLPAATTWAGIPMVLVGGLLSAPLLLAGDLLASLPEADAAMVPLIETCIRSVSPVHYGTLICGAVLLLGGILWRILRAHAHKAGK